MLTTQATLKDIVWFLLNCYNIRVVFTIHNYKLYNISFRRENREKICIILFQVNVLISHPFKMPKNL